MALRTIVQNGDNLLRQTCKSVKVFDKALWQLLDDMHETMIKNNGCGLAGPQISVLRKIVVLEVNGMYLELINPEIIKESGSQCEKESCLSVKNISGYVDRPECITVKAMDRFGYDFTITGEKLLAIALSHEIDHLNGILFIDKMKKDYKRK